MRTLRVRRLVTGAKDRHGNATETYADPIDWPVHGLAPGARSESGGGRDLSVIAWTVFAPVGGNAPTERDVVLVDGVEYPVVGRPEDWSQGPFDGGPGGLIVELRRAEG